MKRLAFLLVMASFGPSAFAQTDSVEQQGSAMNMLEEVNHSKFIPVLQYWKEHDIFQHLDVSLTAGTTGIGFDVASPVTEWAQLRLGYEFMPRFTKRMSFDMTINGQPAKSYDEEGNRQETRFDKLKDFLYSFTGFDILNDTSWVAAHIVRTAFKGYGILPSLPVDDPLDLLQVDSSRQRLFSIMYFAASVPT